MPQLLGADVPGGADALRIDGPVLLATFLVTMLVGLFFGMVPLVAASRSDLAKVLAEGVRGMEARGGQRMHSALVSAELALSLALLVGAGLLVRSADHLQRLRLGFRADGVMAMALSLRERSFGEAADRADFYERLMARVGREVPGASVAVVNGAPFSGVTGTPVETPERRAPETGGPTAMVQVASANYFDVMGIEVLRGRTFNDTDRLGGPPVAVISESLTARLWPNEDPLGRRLRVAPQSQMAPARDPAWSTVVGVVADVRKTLTEENPADLYASMAQQPGLVAEVIVRDPPAGPVSRPSVKRSGR